MGFWSLLFSVWLMESFLQQWASFASLPALLNLTPHGRQRWLVCQLWWKLFPLGRDKILNKLRWYPQQPQRFIFTNLSEACCEAKRWKPCWTWLGSAPKPPGTFSGTFSRTFSGILSNLTQSLRPSPEPSPKPCWTWPGSAPKPPKPSPEPAPQPVQPDLALHQGFLDPSPEASPEPWTRPGSAPKPPRPSPEPSEPSAEPRLTWPGSCASAHRSYSGLSGVIMWSYGLSRGYPAA